MSEKSSAHKDLSHPTIFHGILDSDLPPSEKGVERLGYGITGRLYRLPHSALTFITPSHTFIIPAGTPVCMDAISIHTDESVFPDSATFQPERWIDNPRLDHYLVSFSKCSRQCMGINPPVYAEMYLWLVGVFQSYGSPDVRFEGDEGVLELVGTEREDVEVWGDRVIPVTRPGSKRVMFRVLA